MEATMKPKASLIFGVLVLILTVVGISPAHAAPAPVVNAPSAEASTPVLPASFLCSLNQSVDPGLAKTDSLIPAPKPATTLWPCGACSDFACQGAFINTVCGTNPVTHLPLHCYNLNGSCPEDGQLSCRCRQNIP
jgi:hypothetical protein